MDVTALVDGGLELSVVASFSRVGIAVRRHLYGWTKAPAGALDGQTVLITGPTSGLGRAATDALAGLGARVILVGRSRERLALVRDALVGAHGEDRFPVVVADMGSLGSVRAAVTRVLETESRLDVLVDNAGAIFPERVEGPDGIEAHARDARRGTVRPRVRPAAAAPADGGFAGGRRDVGRHVLPAARPRRPPGDVRAVLRTAGLRPSEARPGRARPRMGAPSRAGASRVSRQRHAPRLGRHARPRRSAADLPAP